MKNFLDEVDEEALAEARHGAFIIECHKVRLWLAAHPGATSWEIKQANGGRYDMCLAKMLHMGMIKVIRTVGEDGRRVNKWEVVPA